MLTTASEVTGEAPAKLVKELERCDRESAAAMKALLTGSAPIIDALLWYTDWCRERELILLTWDASGDRQDVIGGYGPFRSTQRQWQPRLLSANGG